MDTVQSLLAEGNLNCEAPLSFGTVTILVIISCGLGLLWAGFNFMSVKKIDVAKEDDGEHDSLIGAITPKQKKLLIELGEKI